MASANVFPVNGINRTSQIVTTIIPVGQTFPVFQAGNNFYLRVATDEIEIKPNNGSANRYVQGTGLKVDDLNIFANLTLKNTTSNPIVVQIFVGFGNYIDNRLIVSDPSVLQIAYPTSPVPNTLNQIFIPDRSASAIIGMNGESFLALNRVAIYISNIDIASSYDLKNLALTQTLLTIQPQTNAVFPANGDFSIKIPSANINATVSEIYNVIKAV